MSWKPLVWTLHPLLWQETLLQMDDIDDLPRLSRKREHLDWELATWLLFGCLVRSLLQHLAQIEALANLNLWIPDMRKSTTLCQVWTKGKKAIASFVNW